MATKLVDLIKEANDDFRKFVDEQPIPEGSLSSEQIKNFLKTISDKEAEFLAAAINKYIVSEVLVEIVKINNEISKIKRQISNTNTTT